MGSTMGRVDSARATAIGTALLATLAGCVEPLTINVEVLNPCNQEAIQKVDFLRFEPRGTDVDSAGLSTVQPVENATAPPINVPLAEDFQLVVTGHKDDFNAAPSAIGLSARFDFSAAEEAQTVRVPFGLVDRFYRTTDLADPVTCSGLNVPRYGATATYLPENGRVLVVGGASLQAGTIDFRSAIEMYDPATGRFDVVGELRSGGARAFHTATLLADGRVLIAGGEAIVGNTTQSLRSALVIDARDPARVAVSDIIAMPVARTGHTASLLADGRVIMLGGRILDPAGHTYPTRIDVFDPTLSKFLEESASEISGTLDLGGGRFGHSGTVLKTGRDIVVAGGFNLTGPVRGMEIVHFAGDAVQVIAQAGEGSTVGPIEHGAALVDDGRLLLSGGYGLIEEAQPAGAMPFNSLVNVEMWEFKDTRGELIKSCTATLETGRGFHTVSAIGKSQVLFVGGRAPDGPPTATAEVATLATGPNCFAALPTRIDLAEPRAQHASTVLGSGEILIVGGRQQFPGDAFGNSITGAEIFSPTRTP